MWRCGNKAKGIRPKPIGEPCRQDCHRLPCAAMVAKRDFAIDAMDKYAKNDTVVERSREGIDGGLAGSSGADPNDKKEEVDPYDKKEEMDVEKGGTDDEGNSD